MPSTETTTGKRSVILRRAGQALRVTGRVAVTLVVLAGAALAVQFGASELTQRADAAPSAEAAEPMSVSTKRLALQEGYSVKRSFVGQVEAQRTVAVSFELAGRLERIVVDEGESVHAGQVLASQDTSLLVAERTQLDASRSALAAQLTFAEQTLERNTELKRRGFATQADLDNAIAARDELVSRIAEVDAGLANVDIRLSKAVIHAPFDGRVTSRAVDGGETLSPGQSVLGLVELRAPQVRVGVPVEFDEKRLATSEIAIGNQVYPAKLVALRPDIDPVTRTRTALFTLETESVPAFGQTALLRVNEDVDAPGFWLPVTSLQEGARGQWTVLTVSPDKTVRAAPVEVLHAESERVFVRGAFPDGTRLIAAGPQRVTVGQTVALTANQ